eukprot:4532986-Prymnesium_polylepis.1
MHCVVAPGGLPPPSEHYATAGTFVTLPLYLIKDGKHADCWHVGGSNHGCFVHFDVGATPRLAKPRSPQVRSGGMLWLEGDGIFGGLSGTPRVDVKIVRDAGGTALGCSSRYEETETALAYTSSDTFGCRLEDMRGGLAAGFFNVSLYDPARGDAYKPIAARQVDVASAQLFDVELPPRISRIEPSVGSLAGGAAVTISGIGFGSDASALQITVAGAPCDVTAVTEGAAHCKLKARESVTASTGPYPGDRGARWSVDAYAEGQAMLSLVDEFSDDNSSPSGPHTSTTRLQARALDAF